VLHEVTVAERASPADAAAIRLLLSDAGLPVEDLSSAPLQFWVAREAAAIVGAVGLERYGTSALLRSLVVSPRHRHRGLGDRLVRQLEADARAAGIVRLVLLTQTAADFFARRGYRVIDRGSIEGAMRECAQFRSLCPASATCMGKALD